MKIGEVLADHMDGTRDWTLKLLADVSGDDWTFQPRPGLAHALWLCGHLAVSQHLLIHIRVLGTSGVLSDSFARQFPIGAPVPAAGEWTYPSPNEVLEKLAETHARTLIAVRGMPETLLAEPAYGKDGAPHPHYHTKLGAIAHCIRHEAFHAGQLAMIRRIIGKPFLR